ncbi:sugar phosphate isomerase/epimerase, partial [Candidatus Bathyarchaeota archaeon]
GVELNLDEELLKLNREGRRDIASKAESLGLELPSLCTGLFWKYNLASPDESVRRRGIEILKTACQFASDIGAKVVLVVPAVAVPDLSYQETWELSRRSITEAIPAAEEHDVYLGIENVWNKFLYSPLEFRRFIEEFNHPNVRAYFDVGNTQFLGFPHQWIRHLSNLIVSVHVKDFRAIGWSSIRFGPLLTGDVQWPLVMKALREVGYDGYLTVEVSPYPGDPVKSAIDNKTALDIIFKMT